MLFNAFLSSLAVISVTFAAAFPEVKQLGTIHARELPLPKPVYGNGNEPTTNAERLRRGLTPRAPTKRTRAAYAPQPSGGGWSSSHASYGYISVIESATGKQIGYVNQTLNDYGEFGITNMTESALVVSVQPSTGQNQPMNIMIKAGGDNSAGSYFGAAASPSLNNGAVVKTDDFLLLTRTAETKLGAGPMSVENGVKAFTGEKVQAESPIWTMDPQSNTLSASWQNPGISGKLVATKVYYYQKEDAMALTPNGEAFEAEYPGSLSVRLVFVSQ